MSRIEELERQEQWDKWYHERLQESVNRVMQRIPTEVSKDEG